MTTRLTVMVLAIAASACAPRAMAQDLTPPPAAEEAPAAPAAPATPGAPPNPALGEASTRLSDHDRAPHNLQNQIHERTAQLQREAANVARANADLARVNSELARTWTFKDFNVTRAHSPDAPIIIGTQPMDAAAQTELKEDLIVMDKLVREEAARAGADDPSAMSIKLTLLGRQPPLYVEGAGAIFHAAVNWPLAPVGSAGGKKEERPRDPASKWDQAKRELSGYSLPKKRIGVPGGATEPAPLVFEQVRLDALRDALLQVLPEATNIRHLKENEYVFVTIQGIDDGGAPVRMTLKGAKGDIDAAAAGKLKPEEFAQRVAQRIG